MSLCHGGYLQALIALRRSGGIMTGMGILLAGWLGMVTPADAEVSQKPPREAPALRVDKVKVRELPDKTARRPDTAETLQEWRESKPNAPENRTALENAQIRAKLHNDVVKQIEPCWSVPVGARNAENLKVMLRVYLLPDGALAGLPVILGQEHKSDKFHRIAAESARRAVQRCAPLKLPAETYDIWREIELVFDPGGMLGN